MCLDVYFHGIYLLRAVSWTSRTQRHWSASFRKIQRDTFWLWLRRALLVARCLANCAHKHIHTCQFLSEKHQSSIPCNSLTCWIFTRVLTIIIRVHDDHGLFHHHTHGNRGLTETDFLFNIVLGLDDGYRDGDGSKLSEEWLGKCGYGSPLKR